MARDRPHLTLGRWLAPVPRRTLPARRPRFQRDDRREHGEALLHEAVAIAEGHLAATPGVTQDGIEPLLVLRLNIHPGSTLDDEALRALGLRVLTRDPNRAIVVFPDDETLAEMRRHLTEYRDSEDGRRYGNLAVIDSVDQLTAEDKTGRVLAAEPLGEDESAYLDVELFHPGNRDRAAAFVAELAAWLEARGERLTDSLISIDQVVARVSARPPVLRELLMLPIVREVDRRPGTSFELGDLHRLEGGDANPQVQLAENTPGIVVVDSGVAQLHPLLGPVIGDAQVFPDRLARRVVGTADDVDTAYHGHGTAVAGIAVYDDLGRCLENHAFVANVRLFSARVTDERNQYEETSLVETQLATLVEYFVSNYPTAKVFNISLGDPRAYMTDGGKQFRFAATLDRLAYEWRNREIVFVVSAGNIHPEDLMEPEEVLARYPNYLLDEPSARVIDPATAALAISVGGLAYGLGRPAAEEDHAEIAVAGHRDWPSPFTRAGPGLDGAIKPEVVSYAGDMVLARGGVTTVDRSGVPSTNKNWGPPEGRLLRTVAGTSFSTPRVAHTAARLFDEFPGISSNLVRALVGTSAVVPKHRPEGLEGLPNSDDRILRLYGFGIPDTDRAIRSASNDVLFLYEGIMDIDEIQLFEVPELPAELLDNRGLKTLRVCLAFDPPTRATRADNYLGVGMDFALFKNVGATTVLNAVRAMTPAERENLQEARMPTRGDLDAFAIGMNPGPRVRQRGTLQLGTHTFRGRNWRYLGGPLFLAVITKRRWAPTNVTAQRFAVVVSISHEDSTVDIHTRLQARSQAFARVQTRARVGTAVARQGDLGL